MKKVIVITGSSRGIGAATAKLAAARGYAVCVNYLKDQNAANAVVDEIRANGGQAIAVAADMSSEPEVNHLFNIVDAKLGTPTALVNNAGILEKQIRVDQVLVKVHAASLTFSNLMMAKGSPFFVRLMAGGLLKPKPQILGSDVAGLVESVGKNVGKFQPGEDVFGYLADCGKGGYAQYVCAPEKALGRKPANLS